MANGGFRPAYNIQYAVDTMSLAVVGVQVSQSGSDMGLMPPMIKQIQERFSDLALLDCLVDGGFAKHDDITALSEQGICILAPVRKGKDEATKSLERFQPHPGDSEAVIAWRQRMSTPTAKEQYKSRAASVELFNAQARNHGLQQLTVRGTPKTLAIALWHAIAHNLMLFISQLRYVESF